MKTNRGLPSVIPQAATVILTREYKSSFQVYLLKRNSGSNFMGGYYVFPGGAVDREDRRFSIYKNHIDMDRKNMLARFGGDLSESQILAFCVAAIRETLEEAGVFLAHRDHPSGSHLDHARRLRLSANLEKHWFTRLVVDTRWRLSLSALSRWAHWITPELMKRRFDTRFFIAAMPSEQFCQPDLKETVDGLWTRPEDGLMGNLTGKIPLSPPTLVTLYELSRYTDLNDLQAAVKQRQWGPTQLPRLVPLENGAVIVEPWDPMYSEKKIDIYPNDLETCVLPVGEPFSRVWLDDGIWKPVKCLI
jgi:8-oxo-dGTP pyrophosphatase MutT (NUDIX family)